MAFIGAILIGIYLLFFADHKMNSSIRAANRAYELDLKTHNYNEERQKKIVKEIMYSHESSIDGESWIDKHFKYHINDDILRDIEAMKLMKDEGYDYKLGICSSFNFGLREFPKYKGINIWFEKPWYKMSEEEEIEVRKRIGASLD